jgi:hypothetical protein
LVGVHYGNTKRQGFFFECEGFSLNSVHSSRIEDFLRILRQGTGVFACSAKIKFPNSFKNSKVRMHKSKENHRNTNAGIKISLLIAKIPNIPSTN